MADTNPKLNITSLDFDAIKTSFKDYLQSQDQFRDYDFEGSGLSVIMDLLAYNTHYQAYYANMIANESFLDSAVLRASAVSIAKHLNYLPKSYRSSVAYIDLEFLNRTDSQKTSIENGSVFVSAGDRFITNTGNRIFVFTATSNVRVFKEGSRYFARNVEIKEGGIKSITYVYNTNQSTEQKFIIPDLNIDTTSLEIRVSTSTENTAGVENLWERVTDINKLNEDSRSFFLQQNSDLKYEVYFGDGILGKKPEAGNVISMSYRVAAGSISNNIGSTDSATTPVFRYAEDSKTTTTLVLDTDGSPSVTFGGSENEEIQSIKYYAPRNYQAQERAVTAEDYRTLLARDYGEQAESVFVWGGEDNDPPIYGKVFISIKPKNAQKLTQIEKLAIAKNILKEKNVVSIIPEVIDPDYLYLEFDVEAQYDKSKTTLSADSLAASLKNLLYTYSLQNIGKFDKNFTYSVFSAFINNNFNPPVISNTINLILKKKIEPNLTTISSYVINFDNAVYHPIAGYSPVLTSTVFGYQDSTSSETVKPTVDAYIDDDGNGNIGIYKLLNGVKIYLTTTAGTINYDTGRITLLNFAPQSLDSGISTIDFSVVPRNRDIYSRRNQILIASLDDISVTATPQTLRYDPYSASASSFIGNN